MWGAAAGAERARAACARAGEVVYRSWPGVTPAGAVKLVRNTRTSTEERNRERVLGLLAGLHRVQVCRCFCVVVLLVGYENRDSARAPRQRAGSFGTWHCRGGGAVVALV